MTTIFLSYSRSDQDHYASLRKALEAIDWGELSNSDIVMSEWSRRIDLLGDGSEQFDWKSRFREALSQPELTARQKNDLIASMVFALGFCLYMASLRHPQVKDQVQLIDPLIALGLLVYISLRRPD